MSENQSGTNNAVRSSDDVFRLYADKFGDDADGDMHAIGLFAYALVEKDRVDWAEHMVRTTGLTPAYEAVEAWFKAKPASYFEERGNHAVAWFTGFSRALLREEIASDREQAVKDALGNLGKFWPGFWIGNLIGITSNIVFTALVVLFVFAISSDFSFIAWAKRLVGAH